MDPMMEKYFFYNALILLALVIYMLWKPKKSGRGLKLRGRDASRQVEDKQLTGNVTRGASPDINLNHENKSKPLERSLNVIFQYNGHDFDAYEVFGLAAGSSFSDVENAYKTVIAGKDSDSTEIYHLAFKSIKLTRL